MQLHDGNKTVALSRMSLLNMFAISLATSFPRIHQLWSPRYTALDPGHEQGMNIRHNYATACGLQVADVACASRMQEGREKKRRQR